MNGADSKQGEIAIVGMSGRFPGAADPAALWELLANGREGVRRLSEEALRAAGVPADLLAHPRYVKSAALLENADCFDAAFFGYSEQEAAQIDPQHRLFLESAWHALEDSGTVPDSFPGSIGVFAGAGAGPRAGMRPAASGVTPESFATRYAEAIATAPDFLTTRVSYKLNLRGPSLTVQTACSTSLVAIHLACMSLKNGECDLALAGGVSVQSSQGTGYLWQEGGITSRDGTCRAFDQSATGTVPGSGVAVVALRRLEDAIRDGNLIYAVIRGTAVNNDGSEKAGFTAPGIAGQSHVIATAQVSSGIDPRSVQMLEAHGTGTELGDAAELRALTQVFTDGKGFCQLGSIKSNIGHLDAASGATGLLKAALCLHRRMFVPSLHVNAPNRGLRWDSAFSVSTELKPWPEQPWPRRAGVSSFGIGGTNAHAILEEAPARDVYTAPALNVLPLSARTPMALRASLLSLAKHLKKEPQLSLGEVARTLQQGRKAFGVRCALVADDRKLLIHDLEARASRGAFMCADGLMDRSVTVVLQAVTEDTIRLVRELRTIHQSVADSIEQGIEGAAPAYRKKLRAWFDSEHPVRDDEKAFAAAALIAEQSVLALLHSWGVTVCNVIGRDASDHLARADSIIVELEGDSSTQEWAIPEAPHVILFDRRHADLRESELHAASALWERGVGLDWEAVCGNAGCPRVSLPGYPFERKSFPFGVVARTPDPASERLPEDRWFHAPAWRMLPLRPADRTKQARSQDWVIVSVGHSFELSLASYLRRLGGSVTFLVASDGFSVVAHDRMTVDLRSPEHVEKALRALQGNGIQPMHVAYFGGMAEPAAGSAEEQASSAHETGFLGALSVIRAYERVYGGAPVALVAMTSGTAALPTDVDVAPAHAGIHALASVLVTEKPNVRFTVVDLPSGAEEAERGSAGKYIEWIAEEPSAVNRRSIVAYRSGRRLACEYTPEAADAELPDPIVQRGVYVITGGLGQIGLALAEELAARYQARLVLLSRTVLPERRGWAGKLDDPLCPPKLADTLGRFVAIERSGAELMVASVDVSDEAQMQHVVSSIKERFGRVNGVFHLAADLTHGSAGRMLDAVTRRDLEAQFRPKVAGFEILDRLFAEAGLDFGIVFSSNSAILGGASLGAYAASNAYLNCAVARTGGRICWKALSWDGWTAEREEGGTGVTVKEGIDLALRAIRLPSPLVVVSTTDLPRRMEKVRPVLPAPSEQAGLAKPEARPREKRPQTANAYVAPRTELERRIVDLWEETLGIEGIGVEDDLFDLNGDSLQAMDILARIQETFGVEVPLRRFINKKPTVFRLSAEIARQFRGD